MNQSIKNVILKTKHVIFCHCRGERIDPVRLSEIEGHLRKMQADVTILSDLCGISALAHNSMTELLQESGDILLIGCYKRTMSFLLEKSGTGGINNKNFSYINMVETSSVDAIRQINDFCSEHSEDSALKEISDNSGWPSWYPVIDYSRCTACGQCADFCLFGVYEKKTERVIVINPQGCKNLCPACARICPETAIIFPKYKNGGAIGGSDEIDEKAELQRQAQDIELLLGNDIYSALEKRKIRRKSIIKDEEMKKAVSEREDFLNKNRKDLI